MAGARSARREVGGRGGREVMGQIVWGLRSLSEDSALYSVETILIQTFTESLWV